VIDTFAQKARVIIAASDDEARRLAAERIAEIDAHVAEAEDAIARVQDEMAAVLNTMAEIDAQDREALDRGGPVSLRMGEIRREIDEITEAAAEMRSSMAADEARRAEIDGWPEIMTGRREGYEEEAAAIAADIDRIEMEISEARGLGVYLADATKGPELEKLIERLRYVQDEILPPMRQTEADLASEVAELDARIPATRQDIAALEARYAAIAIEYEDLMQSINDVRIERGQARDRHQAEADRLAELRDWVARTETYLADLAAERADLANVAGGGS
jgi:chromosome segregation ATPase